MSMIHFEEPYGYININLIQFIMPMDSRGRYFLVDANANKCRISGSTFDFLQERGVKVYETKRSKNSQF